MTDQITWTDSTRKLRDLKPQEDNPREITRAHAERLVRSLHKFGQSTPLEINPDDTILNGHQRYHVWGASEGLDFEVDVRVSSYQFTREEWQEYTVTHHEGAVGGWDWESLANWEGAGVEDLVDWGFNRDRLLGGGIGLENIEFPEYDESIVDSVKYITCPECGANWPA